MKLQHYLIKILIILIILKMLNPEELIALVFFAAGIFTSKIMRNLK